MLMLKVVVLAVVVVVVLVENVSSYLAEMVVGRKEENARKNTSPPV